MYWSDKVCCQHVRVVFHSWFNTRSQMLLSFLFLLHLFSVSACYQIVTIFMATLSPPQRHRGLVRPRSCAGDSGSASSWHEASWQIQDFHNTLQQPLQWTRIQESDLSGERGAPLGGQRGSGVGRRRRAWHLMDEDKEEMLQSQQTQVTGWVRRVKWSNDI